MNHREERSADWRTIIDKRTESGMSDAAFCKQQGVNPQGVYLWRRRFRAEFIGTGFIRLVPPSNTVFSGVRISLFDHGISLELDRGFDPRTFRDAIDALGTLGG